MSGEKKKLGAAAINKQTTKKNTEKWKMKNNCSLSEQLYTHCCAAAVAASNKKDSYHRQRT